MYPAETVFFQKTPVHPRHRLTFFVIEKYCSFAGGSVRRCSAMAKVLEYSARVKGK
jgi:hypothetical protein